MTTGIAAMSVTMLCCGPTTKGSKAVGPVTADAPVPPALPAWIVRAREDARIAKRGRCEDFAPQGASPSELYRCMEVVAPVVEAFWWDESHSALWQCTKTARSCCFAQASEDFGRWTDELAACNSDCASRLRRSPEWDSKCGTRIIEAPAVVRPVDDLVGRAIAECVSLRRPLVCNRLQDAVPRRYCESHCEAQLLQDEWDRALAACILGVNDGHEPRCPLRHSVRESVCITRCLEESTRGSR